VADFAARRAALVERLGRRQLAAWVLVPGPNLRYLTGLDVAPSERLFLFLAIPEAPPTVVCPAFEAERVRAALPEARVVAYRDETGWAPALARTLAPLGTRPLTLGAEFGVMRLFERAAVAEILPRARWEPLDGDVAALRQVKDAGELAALEAAARAAQAAVEAALEVVRPGASERQVRTRAQVALAEQGTASPFGVLVASGPRSADPHAGAAGDRRLEPGDLVWIDLGAVVDGYVADVTRTAVVGGGDGEAARLVEAVRAAQEAALARVRPGATAAEVDAAARAALGERGLAGYFPHRTGHGLGLEVHEPPFLVDGNEEPLRPGMVFTVEPGVYVPGRGGARWEDDVLVTEHGFRLLTRDGGA
jgi:Xaa-Pro dipeptidase